MALNHGSMVNLFCLQRAMPASAWAAMVLLRHLKVVQEDALTIIIVAS